MRKAIKCAVVCLVAVWVLGGVQGAFAGSTGSAVALVKPLKVLKPVKGSSTTTTTVPEPATLAMTVLGLAGVVVLRRKKAA